MGWEADPKEKRVHDLRHYWNSSHYWSFFNFCGSRPSNSQRVPLRTSLCITSVASRYTARRRSETGPARTYR
jgi:hypothetical protein